MIKLHHTALIGTGYWGSIIFNTLTKMSKNKIYVYDKDNQNSQLLNKRFPKQSKIAKSYDEILNNKKIKNIILATHPSVNFFLGKKALAAKKNLFVEKPLLNNKKKLSKLNIIAKKNKRILMGGYIYLFNSYIKKIKQIIESKELGSIKYIETQRKNLGPIRNEVGSHIDLGSHDISILKYFFKNKLKLKSKIKRNILKKNISDITTLNITIGKIKCEIISSWLNPTKERKLLIVGSKKMLLFDEMDKNNKLKIFNKYAYYPKITKFKKNYILEKARIYMGKTKNIKVNETDTLKNEILYFEKVCKKKMNPITNGKFCLDVLNLII
ncbi:Gfo/Idh/MocA family oxidoreductase [bacterium]|nr:Gfo/Idh/MocA family oxidoreductase [bacterium]